MPKTSGKKMTALALAREKLAAQHAALRQREAADASDLEEIFKLREKMESAALVRDKAIVAAKERYLATVETVEVATGEKLTAMRERGATTASLVALTDLTDTEVRRFTKAFKATQASATAGTADDDDDPNGQRDPAGTQASGDLAEPPAVDVGEDASQDEDGSPGEAVMAGSVSSAGGQE